jgi:hypothetical protein
MRNVALQMGGKKAETFMPEDGDAADRSSTWDIVSLDEAVETDDPTRREGGTHLKYGETRHLVAMGDSYLQISSLGLRRSSAVSSLRSSSRRSAQLASARTAFWSRSLAASSLTRPVGSPARLS